MYESAPELFPTKEVRLLHKDLAGVERTHPLLSTGPTAVTPAVIKPGQTVDIDTSFTTATAYASMQTAFYVTIFSGKKFFTEIDKTQRLT